MAKSPFSRALRTVVAAGATAMITLLPAPAAAQAGPGPLPSPGRLSADLGVPTVDRLAADLGLPGAPAPASAPRRPDCGVERCVALTFDDGPERATTMPLLDTLERKNARASFFVIGRKIAGNEDVLRRMTRLGMDVENHTWDHPDLRRLPADAVTAQIRRTTDAITRTTGVAPRYVRPPYGSWTPGVTPTAGLEPALWEVDTRDWESLDTARVVRAALAGARPGAVILMHDVHPSTVAAVPAIIDGLRERGLTPVSLRDLRGVAPRPAAAPGPAPLPGVPSPEALSAEMRAAATPPRLPEVDLPGVLLPTGSA